MDHHGPWPFLGSTFWAAKLNFSEADAESVWCTQMKNLQISSDWFTSKWIYFKVDLHNILFDLLVYPPRTHIVAAAVAQSVPPQVKGILHCDRTRKWYSLFVLVFKIRSNYKMMENCSGMYLIELLCWKGLKRQTSSLPKVKPCFQDISWVSQTLLKKPGALNCSSSFSPPKMQWHNNNIMQAVLPHISYKSCESCNTFIPVASSSYLQLFKIKSWTPQLFAGASTSDGPTMVLNWFVMDVS